MSTVSRIVYITKEQAQNLQWKPATTPAWMNGGPWFEAELPEDFGPFNTEDHSVVPVERPFFMGAADPSEVVPPGADSAEIWYEVDVPG